MRKYDILVSDLCDEIDILTARLEKAKEEAEYWKNQYNDVMNSSIKHNNEMIGNTLMILLDKK